jgi:hypothetical protein
MESKSWWQSKTIWGILIAALGYFMTQVLKVPEPSLPANPDYNALLSYVKAIQASQGNISEILGQIIGMVGTGIAIYGRVKADTAIK